MYKAMVKVKELQGDTLILQSENRNLMRALILLCEDNGLEWKVMVEQAPREVKFKGLK